MYEFYIEYESYVGKKGTMTLYADTESDAERLFYKERPLSDIIRIECLHY